MGTRAKLRVAAAAVEAKRTKQANERTDKNPSRAGAQTDEMEATRVLTFGRNNLLQVHNVHVVESLQNLHFSERSDRKTVLFLLCVDSLQRNDLARLPVGTNENTPGTERTQTKRRRGGTN